MLTFHFFPTKTRIESCSRYLWHLIRNLSPNHSHLIISRFSHNDSLLFLSQDHTHDCSGLSVSNTVRIYRLRVSNLLITEGFRLSWTVFHLCLGKWATKISLLFAHTRATLPATLATSGPAACLQRSKCLISKDGLRYLISISSKSGSVCDVKCFCNLTSRNSVNAPHTLLNRAVQGACVNRDGFEESED